MTAAADGGSAGCCWRHFVVSIVCCAHPADLLCCHEACALTLLWCTAVPQGFAPQLLQLARSTPGLLTTLVGQKSSASVDQNTALTKVCTECAVGAASELD